MAKKQEMSKNLFIQLPSETNKTPLHRNFVYIPDVVSYFFGTAYKYDLFTTVDDLTEDIKKADEKATTLNDIYSKKTINRQILTINAPFCLTKSLARIRRTAIETNCKDSLEALAVLHNLAKDGKRIAVFNAHGRVFSEDGVFNLAINGANDEEILANTLISQVSNVKTGNIARYGGVYFMSCNSYLDTDTYAGVSPTLIPVVIHTTEHSDANLKNPAKTYWPKN